MTAYAQSAEQVLERKLKTMIRVAERWHHLSAPDDIADFVAADITLSDPEMKIIFKRQLTRMIEFILQAQELGATTQEEITSLLFGDPQFREICPADAVGDELLRSVIAMVLEELEST